MSPQSLSLGPDLLPRYRQRPDAGEWTITSSSFWVLTLSTLLGAYEIQYFYCLQSIFFTVSVLVVLSACRIMYLAPSTLTRNFLLSRVGKQSISDVYTQSLQKTCLCVRHNFICGFIGINKRRSKEPSIICVILTSNSTITDTVLGVYHQSVRLPR